MHLLSTITSVRTVLLAVMVTVAAVLTVSPAVSQVPMARDLPPESVQQFIALSADPAVQKWLQQQAAAAKTDAAFAQPAQTKVSFAEFTTRFRQHVSSLLTAAGSLHSEIMAAVAVLEREIQANGGTRPVFLLVAFVVAGLGAQWLFRKISTGWRSWIERAPLITVRDRVTVVGARLLWAACYVLSFALGSIGFFLAFEWPPLVREIVVGYLFAVVVFRLADMVFDVLLDPGAATNDEPPGFRVIPLTDQAAIHWARRLSYLVGWFAFGWVTVRLLGALGFSVPSRQLVAYALGVVLLVIAIEGLWRRPHVVPGVEATGRIGRKFRNWLWTAYFIGGWALWVAGAMKLFWIVVVCAALPGVLALSKASIANVLRSPGSQNAKERATVASVLVERGIRAALIVGAILLLAKALDVEFAGVTMQDTPVLRIVRGILSAGIVLMAIDLAWNVLSVLIDRKLGDTNTVYEAGSEKERRRTRVRTLLPILRNVLMILFVAVAIMMALSSLGVEIAPLIAGAGVVGVAIGFGAQTVVKDIISGMFYLLDDAFRVGEYIQSGNYKGSVESFSLRSVKLRHHRGAVYIVPFSELGAIQNMSRDWVIEKLTITVTYDADVEKARKIIKKIGQELSVDPEFKAVTIEPLKMQGIESFGDSGLLLRMKFMTLPGEQFTLKRRALRMIHQAFHEAGIRIAVPTVQVAGEKTADVAAAAQQALTAHKEAVAAGAG
ncbi:mechanosensitive ion channel MscS-like protein [Rhizobium gallicum bv. gallicum R602sp]|uniref:Mechanosensitive ion channel MscS-like protein n=1 Tax=Rhizobium gallicum bv. gallicum R602sp TaxID=1041138 RepID=A0A0B4X5V8_9HYPH|nr:mechanosensitive ion channel family protein [Rhizobium gallicum]AJD42521.1 mechanosensitive ion channel MscS-like protein [Rhizobium gallicum bv. gallicum R602sp]